MDACLTDQDLGLYVDGSATAEQMSAWNEHLDGCLSCARRVIHAQSEQSRQGNPSGEVGTGPAETVTVKPAAGAVLDAGADLPEDALPGYRILKELHRGGQGVVYQAVQHSTKRKVALKVMLEGPFAGPESKRRFQREIEDNATSGG